MTNKKNTIKKVAKFVGIGVGIGAVVGIGVAVVSKMSDKNYSDDCCDSETDTSSFMNDDWY